jgi:hypothetical protein
MITKDGIKKDEAENSEKLTEFLQRSCGDNQLVNSNGIKIMGKILQCNMARVVEALKGNIMWGTAGDDYV